MSDEKVAKGNIFSQATAVNDFSAIRCFVWFGSILGLFLLISAPVNPLYKLNLRTAHE